mmetsp:Transcript_6402/g.11708  ORF Transcript_6402/g.11708 Transcript_6402/m.11708 type:complete len:239 (-) Transcript_6402:808-1524(-)
MGGDVHWLRVGGGVAERLHGQVCREAKASQILELVTGHGPCGVLGAYGAHGWLAVGSGNHARNPTSLTHQLLGKGEALYVHIWLLHGPEGLGRFQLQRFPRFPRQSSADDQWDAATCLHLIVQNVGLQGKLRDHLLCSVLLHHSFVEVDINHIPHVHVLHVHLHRQRAGVLHGVEEDGGDHAAEHKTACALVRGEGDVVTHVPKDGVGSRLSGGARAHNVSDVHERKALLFQLGDLLC